MGSPASADSAHINFIGRVHSSLKRLEDCPLQEREEAPAATIEIFPHFMEGIKDVKAGDKLIVFTWLHQSDRSVLSTHPRNDANLPLTGIFSTRSPDRPNPIGIHFAKVSGVESGRLKVAALEVLDQTPVVDIKPDLS
jgi:tRNA-Thr(GGU) m(6)t(6)A37 methyltransferase TsaA